jgi:hypothetical protein
MRRSSWSRSRVEEEADGEPKLAVKRLVIFLLAAQLSGELRKAAAAKAAQRRLADSTEADAVAKLAS